jgi:hypothetical protein
MQQLLMATWTPTPLTPFDLQAVLSEPLMRSKVQSWGSASGALVALWGLGGSPVEYHSWPDVIRCPEKVTSAPTAPPLPSHACYDGSGVDASWVRRPAERIAKLFPC